MLELKQAFPNQFQLQDEFDRKWELRFQVKRYQEATTIDNKFAKRFQNILGVHHTKPHQNPMRVKSVDRLS